MSMRLQIRFNPTGTVRRINYSIEILALSIYNCAKFWRIIMSLIIAGAGAYALSRFADQALADSLSLRTVRVGIDPLRWVSSHFTGFSNSDNFHIGAMTDDYGDAFGELFDAFEYKLTQEINKLSLGKLQTIALTVQKWVLCNIFVIAVNDTYHNGFEGNGFSFTLNMWIFKKCTMHAISYVAKTMEIYQLFMGDKNSGDLRVAVALSFSSIAALFTPTLKFRYKEADAQTRFTEWRAEDLPMAGNALLETKKELSPTNIGIFGTLKNIGLPSPDKASFGTLKNSGLPSQDKASKVALGALKLALAGAAAYGTFKLCPDFIQAHKIALITGASLALI